MSTEAQKIGNLIKEIRTDRGLTQTEFAEKLKTSQSAVNRIENGKQNLSMEMLARISDVLGRQIVSVSSAKTINFKIEGGKELKGEIETKVSKNATVGLLCASLLNRGTTILERVPRIEEVKRILEVLQSIGVSVKWHENGDLELKPPQKLKLEAMDKNAAKKTRTIIMFLGPLMHRYSTFNIPYAGGCALGRRTVKPHLMALEQYGMEVVAARGQYEVTVKKQSPEKIVMYESGDTPTENVLMAAALTPHPVTIKMASANYAIQDLCHFLVKAGVKIEGIGTTTLTVHGIKDLNKKLRYAPSEDPIESMAFLSIAATTNSSITIKRCPIDFLELELLKMEKMGFSYEIIKEYKARNGETDLVDIKTHKHKGLVALDDKIYARPYPGLNIDNLPFFVPLAAIAKGKTLIHDWVFENRAIYYTELSKLGVSVELVDAHRVYVTGPAKFQPVEVTTPPALRPAVIVLIAMLAANGTSILRNVYSINRGYEDLANRLNALGAKIEMITE